MAGAKIIVAASGLLQLLRFLSFTNVLQYRTIKASGSFPGESFQTAIRAGLWLYAPPGHTSSFWQFGSAYPVLWLNYSSITGRVARPAAFLFVLVPFVQGYAVGSGTGTRKARRQA